VANSEQGMCQAVSNAGGTEESTILIEQRHEKLRHVPAVGTGRCQGGRGKEIEDTGLNEKLVEA